MDVQEKIGLLEEMMELEKGDLELDTVLEEIDEYDSFFKLYLVTYVKKEMGKRLTVAEMEELSLIHI